MNLTRTTVKFHEIDLKDKFFCYSDHRYDQEMLLKSLCFSGILNPVVLLKRDSRYQVITGFRRLEVLKELNLKTIPALLAGSKARPEELFRLSVLENQTTRNLNLFEKANLLAKLQQVIKAKKKVMDLFMPLVGLPPSLQKMDELLTLAELPESLVEYILSKNLPARRFRHLRGLSKNSLAFLTDFVHYLTPSASIFEEITKELVEVANRDNISVDKIAESCGLIQVVKNESVEKTERLTILRERVFTLRYPILNAENKKLADRLETLDLPSCLGIKWDKSLERKGLEIKLILDNEDDFEAGLRCLEELKSNKVLKEFI